MTKEGSARLANVLKRTGRFEHTRQASSGIHTFMLYGYDHATIYVLPSGRRAHIRVNALVNGRFPNNDRLQEYLREHVRKTDRAWGDNLFVLRPRQLGRVLEIIGVR